MRAAVVPNRVVVFDERQTAATGSNLNPDLSTLFNRKLFAFDTSVRECFARCRQGERNRARNMLAVLRAQLGFPIKIPNLRRDFHRRIRNVERFDPSDAAFAALQAGPECFAADANWRDTPHAGDDNSARSFEAT